MRESARLHTTPRPLVQDGQPGIHRFLQSDPSIDGHVSQVGVAIPVRDREVHTAGVEARGRPAGRGVNPA
ncbi:uncharacterized protein DNG_07421 [Cephalotrichum gorgonifer]|uniref:Uncharacterized protein n=1 Tax=Cephalotrichum gorgonifer TaxID=2041049 RepID=A0AAE8N1L2_9PEZI|nr:uncharacterized protein DNG_07421 [Cephalotrichum gorgonifer]